MPEYVVMISYGELKARLKVDSNISMTDLKKRAASSFDDIASGNLALQFYDKDFEEWMIVNDEYTLENKARLMLVTVDDKGNIIKDDGKKQSKTPDKPPAAEEKTPGPVSTTEPSSQANTDALVARYKQSIRDLTINEDESKAQGIAFIIGMSDAMGSREDLNSMKRAFESLNFAVKSEHNVHADEIKALCRAISEYDFPKRVYYKYIAFYYAGHGGIDTSGDSFIQPVKDSDEVKRVYIERDIIRVIELQKTKCLLFFFDCCMSYAGKDDKNPPNVKVTSTHPNELIACASSFGEKAGGDTKHGGYWTRTLAKNLGKNERLTTILEDTTAEVKEKYKQNCSSTVSLAKAVNLLKVSKSDVEVWKKSPKVFDAHKLLSRTRSAQWNNLGLRLEVPQNERDSITTRPDSNSTKLESVLSYWASSYCSPVTWENLYYAVKDLDWKDEAQKIFDFVGKDEIKEKYIPLPDWKPLSQIGSY